MGRLQMTLLFQFIPLSDFTTGLWRQGPGDTGGSCMEGCCHRATSWEWEVLAGSRYNLKIISRSSRRRTLREAEKLLDITLALPSSAQGCEMAPKLWARYQPTCFPLLRCLQHTHAFCAQRIFKKKKIKELLAETEFTQETWILPGWTLWNQDAGAADLWNYQLPSIGLMVRVFWHRLCVCIGVVTSVLKVSNSS